MASTEKQGTKLSAEQQRARLGKLLRSGSLKKAVYPLTPAQLAMWFQQKLDAENTAYNIPLALCLHGNLQKTEAVKRCLEKVVQKQTVLRSTVIEAGAEPVQRVHSNVPVDMPYRSLVGAVGEDWESAVVNESMLQANKAFNLTEGPLFRFELVQIKPDLHVLLATFHHIVFDGWSLGVFLQDFSEAFIALADGKDTALPKLPVVYGDYVKQLRERNAKSSSVQLEYWKDRLQGAPSSLDLPTTYRRPERQTFNGRVHSVLIDPKTVIALRRLSRTHEATFFMTALASFYVLLGRWSGQSDVVLGVSIANRESPAHQQIVGLFSDVLPMRAEFDDDPSFEVFLRRVRTQCLSDYDHTGASLTQLIEAVAPAREPSRHPLFQAGFDYQNTPWPDLGDLVSVVHGDTGSAKLDLNLNLSQDRDTLVATFEYNTDLFSAEAITRLANCFKTLLASIAKTPTKRLSELSLLTQDERDALVSELSWQARGEYQPSTALAQINAQIQARPSAIALVDQGREFTYAWLDGRAKDIAQQLLAGGVQHGDVVGVLLPRCADQIASLLAVWRAGAAYVPLDETTPQLRLSGIIEDAELKWLLTADAAQADLDLPASITPLSLDATRSEAVLPLPNVDLGDTAYIIYTSGTSGRPKGVMISHEALGCYAKEAAQDFSITPADRVLQFASISFDASAEEIYPCLCSGATLVLRDEKMPGSAQHFFSECEALELSVIDIPTAYWHDIVDTLREERALTFPPGIRLVIIGGEAAQPERVAAWLDRVGSDVQLLNTYGPTEATVTVTTADLAALEVDYARCVSVPIGRPHPHVDLYILDTHGVPVPPGVYGEVYVGGPVVGQGYYGRTELTQRTFLPDRFTGRHGAHVYKTGDYARFDERGGLEFLGRIDGQVKVRGFRVELGDIDAVLQQHPAVAKAAVLPYSPAGQASITALSAYVERTPDHSVTAQELRDWVAKWRPAYMVPTFVTVVPSMPMTVSGKIDQQALLALAVDDGGARRAFKPPRTEDEHMLCTVWEQLLGHKQVGRDESFFELGGHSLLVTRMLSRIRRLFHVDLPLKSVFDHPTVAKLVAEIQRVRAAGGSLAADIPLRPKNDKQAYRLSHAQQRVWFLDLLLPGSTAYNNASALKLAGRVDIDVLEQALHRIVERHEILRTVFVEDNGLPYQVVQEHGEVQLERRDLQALDDAECEAAVTAAIAANAQWTFDLCAGPLLRMEILKCGPEQFVLLFNWHHIVTDAWSLGVFMHEIAANYAALAAGHAPDLPALPLQYADYAHWEESVLTPERREHHLAYWRDTLANWPASLALPTQPQADRSTPAASGALLRRTLPASLVPEMRAVASELEATPFMVGLAAFYVLLSRYSGQTDIVVGTPVSGRRHESLERLIGFFVNTLAIRVDLADDPTVTELLGRVRQACLGAFSHQELPFDQVVDAVVGDERGTDASLFRVMFIYEAKAPAPIALPGVEVTPLPAGERQAKFDLTLSLVETDAGIEVVWEYRPEFFAAQTIEQMSTHFEALLAGMISVPESLLCELPMLDRVQRRHLLDEFSGATSAYPSQTLIERFEAQVAESGASLAAVTGSEQITYAALNARANRLAAVLRAKGVGHEDLVGICLPRSLEMLTAVLAVQKAGGAFVPLDPNYPAARLDYLINDSGVGVVLSQRSVALELPESVIGLWLDDAEVMTELCAQSPDNAPLATTPESLAYVIYTSGSTGNPKGVAIEQRNASAMVQWALGSYTAAELSRVLASTSLNFDLSVFELFAPWSAGGTVVLVDDVLSLIESALTVSLINTVPSAATTLLANGAVPAGVQVINLAGEPLPPSLANALMAAVPGVQVCNLYGPSEDTTYSSWARFESPVGDSMTIGRPIDGAKFYVADEHQTLLPVGAVGELYIGGTGVARGYLHRPELTHARFVCDRISGQPGRLYRTGDLVRWRDDGQLEFLGRADDQVKIRGFRVELGEIEHALLSDDAVSASVVVVRTPPSGEPQLVGYVAAAGAAGADDQALEQRLRQSLKAQLPAFMQPQSLVVLDALPLTPNGKVDRRALPAPEFGGGASAYVAPSTPTEQTLAKIWAELLGAPADQISVEDSFFNLGGHSLLVVRLVSAVRSQFDCELKLQEVFALSTLSMIAQFIELKTARASAVREITQAEEAVEEIEW